MSKYMSLDSLQNAVVTKQLSVNKVSPVNRLKQLGSEFPEFRSVAWAYETMGENLVCMRTRSAEICCFYDAIVSKRVYGIDVEGTVFFHIGTFFKFLKGKRVPFRTEVKDATDEFGIREVVIKFGWNAMKVDDEAEIESCKSDLYPRESFDAWMLGKRAAETTLPCDYNLR